MYHILTHNLWHHKRRSSYMRYLYNSNLLRGLLAIVTEDRRGVVYYFLGIVQLQYRFLYIQRQQFYCQAEREHRNTHYLCYR